MDIHEGVKLLEQLQRIILYSLYLFFVGCLEDECLGRLGTKNALTYCNDVLANIQIVLKTGFN